MVASGALTTAGLVVFFLPLRGVVRPTFLGSLSRAQLVLARSVFSLPLRAGSTVRVSQSVVFSLLRTSLEGCSVFWT